MEQVQQNQQNTIHIENDGSHSTINKYLIVKFLDKGSQGKVKLCQNIDTGKYYAMKITKDLDDEDKILDMDKEYQSLKLVQGHENILQVIDYFEDTYIKKNNNGSYKARCLVLELVENGCMFNYVKVMGGFHSAIAKYYFKCHMSALKHMHDKGVCHRDIKLENTLLDENYVLKICDLGFCADISKPQTGHPGTQSYKSPEVNSRIQGYSGEKYDVFSSGVCFFLMNCGSYPFSKATPKDKYYLAFVKKNDHFWEYQKQQTEQRNINTAFIDDPDFIELVNNMLEYNPDKRWTVQQVLESNYLNKQDLHEGQPLNINQQLIKYNLGQNKSKVQEDRQNEINDNKKQKQQQQKLENPGYQIPQGRAVPQDLVQDIQLIKENLQQEKQLVPNEKLIFTNKVNSKFQEQLRDQKIQVVLRKDEVIPVITYIFQNLKLEDFNFNTQDDSQTNVKVSQTNIGKIIASYIDQEGQLIEIQSQVVVEENQENEKSDFNIYNIFLQRREGDFVYFKQLVDQFQQQSLKFL